MPARLASCRPSKQRLSASKSQGSKATDYSSTLPMRIARAVGAAPRAIAEAIVGSASESPMLASVEVAGTGFYQLRPRRSLARPNRSMAFLQHGPAHAVPRLGDGIRAQVEFVSINPTGPLDRRPRQDCRLRRRAGADYSMRSATTCSASTT